MLVWCTVTEPVTKISEPAAVQTMKMTMHANVVQMRRYAEELDKSQRELFGES